MKINELIWLYSIEHEHTKKINLVVIDKLAEVNVQNLLLELYDSFLWQTNIVIISMCYATDVIHYYFVYWEAFFNLYHTECILLMYVHLFNAVFVNHLCWYIGGSLFIFIALPHSVARICLFCASCGGVNIYVVFKLLSHLPRFLLVSPWGHTPTPTPMSKWLN